MSTVETNPPKAERHLAVILASDIVGYSGQMERDEIGTLQRLRDLRRNLIEPKVAEHRGRVFKTTGDGFLAEFVSALDAVHCAVSIQRLMAERNLDLSEDSRFRLRIGINLGDVFHEGEDVFGDGVNIAARLESIAPPGGIYVSRAACDPIRERFSFDFEDLGEHHVKNITRPIQVFGVRIEGVPEIEMASDAAMIAPSLRSASAPAPPGPVPSRWRFPIMGVVSLAFVLGGVGAAWYITAQRHEAARDTGPIATSPLPPRMIRPEAAGPPLDASRQQSHKPEEPPSTPTAAPSLTPPTEVVAAPPLTATEKAETNGTPPLIGPATGHPAAPAPAVETAEPPKSPEPVYPPSSSPVGSAIGKSGATEPPVAAVAPTPPAPAPRPADGQAGWSVDEKREVQQALRSFGNYQGETDGDFGPGTTAAIKQFQSFAGDSETGTLTGAERARLDDMAQHLSALLDRGATSPDGVGAVAVKGSTARYARAWAAQFGTNGGPDLVEAVYWYGLAAADGDIQAFTNLGLLLARGQGVAKPQPADAAVLWWAAAARGGATAMFNLGAMWEHGIGVSADLAKAKAWYRRGAAKGNPAARAALQRLGA